MNICHILGNIGSDPELRDVGDSTVCNFSVATSEKFKNRKGEMVEKTQWHRCAAWGARGEAIARFFRKGSRIQVSGKIEYRESEGKYYTDIVVQNFSFCERRQDGDKAASRPKEDWRTGSAKEQEPPPPSDMDNMSEELPF